MSAAYGINPVTGRCRQCGKLQVRMTTNGSGHAVEVASPCSCPKTAPLKPKSKRAWAIAIDDDRRRACICQRCDLPTVGKPKIALYCETHRKEARAEVEKRNRKKAGNRYQRTYYERHGDLQRQRSREYYQNDPERRESRNEYKRAWRKLNRNKVREQKRRSYRRRKLQFADYIEKYQAEVAAEVRKPQRRKNKHGERLCVTPYCRSVMTGRAKKCLKCKVNEIRAARRTLEQRRAA